jgi:hypothetical protein
MRLIGSYLDLISTYGPFERIYGSEEPLVLSKTNITYASAALEDCIDKVCTASRSETPMHGTNVNDQGGDPQVPTLIIC